MKKLLFTTGITLVILSGCVYSQQTGHTLAAARVKNSRPQNQYINNVNVRAMRHFVGYYGDVPEVIWHQTNANHVAVFTRDSVQHRVVYTSRGDLSYSIKYYEENRMARNVRAQVKSIYYDYKIYVVQEVETPDHAPVYIVNLQGDTDWMKIRLCQGEMDIMEHFKKSK